MFFLDDFNYVYENTLQIYIKTIKDLRGCGLLNPGLSVNQHLMKNLNLLTFEEIKDFVTLFDSSFIKLYKNGFTIIESLIIHRRFIEQNKKALSQDVSLEQLALPRRGEITNFTQAEIETAFEKFEKMSDLLNKIFYEAQRI